jgi:hypothetical protein
MTVKDDIDSAPKLQPRKATKIISLGMNARTFVQIAKKKIRMLYAHIFITTQIKTYNFSRATDDISPRLKQTHLTFNIIIVS